MKLHETLKKIYDNIIKLNFIEVLSNDGWQEIDSVNIGHSSKLCIVKTDKQILECTPDHIIFDKFNEEIFAKDSLGQSIKTKTGLQKVVDVQIVDKNIDTYDLSLKDTTSHTYYANGVLSHNCVICDEFAFLAKNIADKLFTSMYPVISSSKNGKFIIVSTPNGTSNLYYDIWRKANSKDAKNNLDGWKPFEMYWWQVPGHDEQWKKKQIEAIGATRFAQEFNNEFLTASTIKKLIPDDITEKYKIKLSEYKTRGIEPKKQRIISQNEDEVYEFFMWHEFKNNHAYLASADIAEGISGDNSVLYIWDVTDLSNITMCAKFSSSTVSLVQFAYISQRILKLYGNPWLAAERNGVSAGMLDSLRITYGYQNIISENKKNEPGIYSHVQIKSKACLWCRDMMTTQGFGFTLYDKDLISEMQIFVKKETKQMHNVYHAMPGPDSHDDHIMTFIWALYILQPEIIEKYFIVCQTFTSNFGNIYPRIVQSDINYSDQQYSEIQNDPLYKEFIDFKNEVMNKLKEVSLKENDIYANDMFRQSIKDDYFGDYSTEPQWNDRPFKWNVDISQMYKTINPPAFGGGLNRMPTFIIT